MEDIKTLAVKSSTMAITIPNATTSRNSSRRRRRRSKSDSRSLKGVGRGKKPAEAKESPGYLEYKQQKFEAQQWQERRLQAQALALCLEEREQQKLQAQGSQQSLIPPLPTGRPAAPEVAPPPQKVDPPSSVASEGGLAAGLIPTSTLRLIEAELGHCVSLGDKPLTAEALESVLATAKRKGKIHGLVYWAIWVEGPANTGSQLRLR